MMSNPKRQKRTKARPQNKRARSQQQQRGQRKLPGLQRTGKRNHTGPMFQNRKLTLPEKAKINSKKRGKIKRSFRTNLEYKNHQKQLRKLGLSTSAFHKDMETPRDINRFYKRRAKKEMRKVNMRVERFTALHTKGTRMDPFEGQFLRQQYTLKRDIEIEAEREMDRGKDQVKFQIAEAFAQHRLNRKREIYGEYLQEHAQNKFQADRKKEYIANTNLIGIQQKRQMQQYVKNREAKKQLIFRHIIQQNKIQRHLQKTLLYPQHNVVTVPAYSGDMRWGKVVSWEKKIGDFVQPGEVLCHLMTSDGNLVSIDATEPGYVAKLLQPASSSIQPKQRNIEDTTRQNTASLLSRLNPFSNSSDRNYGMDPDGENSQKWRDEGKIAPGKPVAIIVPNLNAVQRFSKFSLDQPQKNYTPNNEINSSSLQQSQSQSSKQAQHQQNDQSLANRWSRFVQDGIDEFDPQNISQLNLSQGDRNIAPNKVNPYQSLYPMLFSIRKNLPRFVQSIERTQDLYQNHYNVKTNSMNTSHLYSPPSQPSTNSNSAPFPSSSPRSFLKRQFKPQISNQFSNFLKKLYLKKANGISPFSTFPANPLQRSSNLHQNFIFNNQYDSSQLGSNSTIPSFSSSAPPTTPLTQSQRVKQPSSHFSSSSFFTTQFNPHTHSPIEFTHPLQQNSFPTATLSPPLASLPPAQQFKNKLTSSFLKTNPFFGSVESIQSKLSFLRAILFKPKITLRNNKLTRDLAQAGTSSETSSQSTSADLANQSKTNEMNSRLGIESMFDMQEKYANKVDSIFASHSSPKIISENVLQQQLYSSYQNYSSPQRW